MAPDKLENGAQHSSKMAPGKLENGAQSCFSKFDCRFCVPKLFVKAVCILLVSFTLSHFYKSTLTLRQVLQPHDFSLR